MLALLLARTLERALADASVDLTSAAALETLDTCYLNRLGTPSAVTPFYCITNLTAEQRALLQALHLEHLGDHELVNENITPR